MERIGQALRASSMTFVTTGAGSAGVRSAHDLARRPLLRNEARARRRGDPAGGRARWAAAAIIDARSGAGRYVMPARRRRPPARRRARRARHRSPRRRRDRGRQRPDYAVALYGALAAGATVESANPARGARAHPRLIAVPNWFSPTAVRGRRPRGNRRARNVVRLHRLATLLAAPWPRRPSGCRMTGAVSPSSGRPACRSSRSTGTRARARSWTRSPSPLGRLEGRRRRRLPVPFPHCSPGDRSPHALSRRGWCEPTSSSRSSCARSRLAATVVPAEPPLVVVLARHPLVDRLDLTPLRR